MEADWDEISRMVVPPSGLHMLPTPASTIAFDDSQELLWVGNDQVSLALRPTHLPQAYRSRVESLLSMVQNYSDMSRSGHILQKDQSDSFCSMSVESCLLLPIVYI